MAGSEKRHYSDMCHWQYAWEKENMQNECTTEAKPQHDKIYNDPKYLDEALV